MGGYQVPTEFLRKYSPKEIHDLKRAFKEFDQDHNGHIDATELSNILHSIGEPVTESRVKSIIREVDLNHNEMIEFSEFLTILHSLRGGNAETSSTRPSVKPKTIFNRVPSGHTESNRSSFSAAEPVRASFSSAEPTRSSFSEEPVRASFSGYSSTRSGRAVSSSDAGIPQLASVVQKHLQLHEVRGESGGMHSYSEDEKVAFTEHINNCLSSDRDLKHLLPLDPHSNGLFTSVIDGVLLNKLINQAVPDTVDDRAINKGKKLNVYQKTENQNLCINAAKSIGCTVVNIGPADLIEGKPILILGLVWQIVKIQLTSTINLKHHPELVRLLLDGESLEEFMKLPPDQILLRWMNYHLREAQYEKRVTNFGMDVKDAKAYSVLLHQIAPKTCDLCRESDAHGRAIHVIENARRLQVETFIKPTDITSGNTKLNMSFVAQLFNTCPALLVLEEDKEVLAEVLDDDDIGDTREERVFRMWINSLNIENVYINNLFSDLRDGLIILKLMDKIEPGIVSWSKVNLLPKNKFKKVENCNYCVVLGKQMKFSLVNIGGVDISVGNKKLILALIWQLMRHQQLKMLSALGKGGRIITDKDIIDWANHKVQAAGKNRHMIQFRDLSLGDGLFLIDLIYAIEPRAVNYDVVTPGRTSSEKEQNAKYALSAARKIGAAVFLTFEDIVEVKPKMIMTFVATLMSVDMNK